MASSVITITLDGILRRPGTEAINYSGQHLYNALVEKARVAILGSTNEERDKWFLASNGLSKHAYLIKEDLASAPSLEERRMVQINLLRDRQATIEMAIEPDPGVAAYLYKNAVPVLVYLHPAFSHPAFRPDYEGKIAPWDRLVEELHYQRVMKASQVIQDEEVEEL